MNLLAELYSYSQRHAIETTTESQRVRYELVLDKDGFVDLRAIDEIMQVPRVLKDRSSGIEPRSFNDTVKYVLLAGRHFDAFWALVEEQAPARVVTALKAFLASRKVWEKTVAKKLGEREDATDDDVVVITVRGVKGYLHDLPEAATKPSLLETEAECCVTGVKCFPMRLHPSVKGVPGTQKGRVPLISFNAPVYEFEGREQGENYPVSSEVAVGYTAALSDMLMHADPDNMRRRKAGVELPDGRVLLMWTETADLGPVLDVATCYHNKDNPNAVTDAWARFDALAPQEATVRLLVLQGFSGRISILRWETRPYNELLEGIRRYREDFRHVTSAPALLSLMNALESERQLLSKDMWSAAYEAFLLNLPLPRPIYTFAVDRMMGSLEPQKSNQSWTNNLPTKVAWVNSYRRRKNMPTHNPPDANPDTLPVKADYFPTQASPAFQEGRWLAIAEQIQFLYVNRRGRAHVNDPFGNKLHEYTLNPRRTKTQIQTQYLSIYLAKIGGWEKVQACQKELEEITQALAQHPTPRRATLDQRSDMARGYEAQRLYLKRVREYNKAHLADNEEPEVETPETEEPEAAE